MNKPKFKYDKDYIVFFITYRGSYVELLRAKLQTADFTEIQRLRLMAVKELDSFTTAMSYAKLVA